MSKIITTSYLEKLNEIIDEFDSSPNLDLLVDFFIEEVEKDINRNGNRNKKIFSSNIFEKLNEIKNIEELKKIFTYINIIINTFSNQYLHIHINADLSENTQDNLITLFTWRALAESLYDNLLIENEIKTLKTETSRDLIMPTDNNGHITNQILKRRHGLKHKLRFFEKIKSLINANTSSGMLINNNTSAFGFINLSDFSEFPDPINTHLNFGDTLRNTFIKIGEDKVLRLATIINLFPSITGQNIWFKDFIRDEISSYKNFKKVITITSGEKTPEGLLDMQKQNKFQAEEIYTIFSFELYNYEY